MAPNGRHWDFTRDLGNYMECPDDGCKAVIPSSAEEAVSEGRCELQNDLTYFSLQHCHRKAGPLRPGSALPMTLPADSDMTVIWLNFLWLGQRAEARKTWQEADSQLEALETKILAALHPDTRACYRWWVHLLHKHNTGSAHPGMSEEQEEDLSGTKTSRLQGGLGNIKSDS